MVMIFTHYFVWKCPYENSAFYIYNKIVNVIWKYMWELEPLWSVDCLPGS